MVAHIDVDAFFASVLQRTHPHLRGKPLLALGMGGGCVIAASYEAKATGITTGMRLKEAQALCPGCIAMPVEFGETGLASKQVESVIHTFCACVQQYSVDEWFLDLRSCVGGVPYPLDTWADSAHQDILQTTGLSASVGVAPSKLLAKMASEYRKPSGRTVISAQAIESFLRDRPIEAIPGIGSRRAVHAREQAWTTAWDMASARPEHVRSLFGKAGTDLQSELQGRMIDRVLDSVAPPKSISRARSFRATSNVEQLWAYLTQHAAVTVSRMRKHELSCRRITVWLRDARYRHYSHHVALPRAMDTEQDLLPHIRRTFHPVYTQAKECTQVGLCLWNLTPRSAVQLSLFADPVRQQSDEELQRSMDMLRSRFGRASVMRGSQLAIAKTSPRTFQFPTVDSSQHS